MFVLNKGEAVQAGSYARFATMTVTKLELCGLDLLVALDSQTTNQKAAVKLSQSAYWKMAH